MADDTKATTKPKADEQTADEPTAAVTLREKREQLLANLRALDEQAAASGVVLENTHVLTLSNGERVEHTGAVSTHHSTNQGVFPVVRIDPIDPQADRR